MTWPPVRMAISCSISLRRSPKDVYKRQLLPAGYERHCDGHALGDVVQPYYNRHHHARAAEHAGLRRAGVAGAYDHALRHVVQGYGAGHDDARYEELIRGGGAAVLAGHLVLGVVVGVDELVQVVGGLWMVFVYMLYLVVGLAVNPRCV